MATLTSVRRVLSIFSGRRPPIECPTCGTLLEVADSDCDQCGTELVVECRNCGASIDANVRECPSCGGRTFEVFWIE